MADEKKIQKRLETTTDKRPQHDERGIRPRPPAPLPPQPPKPEKKSEK